MLKWIQLSIIVILAVSICQNEATAVDEIDCLISRIQVIRSSTLSFESTIWQRVGRKIREFEGNFQSEMATLIDEAFSNPIEFCKESLQSQFDKANNTYWQSRENCQFKASFNITLELRIFERMGGAKPMETKMKNIKSICYHHDIGVFEQCLERYLPELRRRIDYFEENYNIVESQVDKMTAHDSFDWSTLNDCVINAKQTFRNKIELLLIN